MMIMTLIEIVAFPVAAYIVVGGFFAIFSGVKHGWNKDVAWLLLVWPLAALYVVFGEQDELPD